MTASLPRRAPTAPAGTSPGPVAGHQAPAQGPPAQGAGAAARRRRQRAGAPADAEAAPAPRAPPVDVVRPARSGTDLLLRDRRRRGHVRDARSRDGAVGVGDRRVQPGQQPLRDLQPPADVGGARAWSACCSRSGCTCSGCVDSLCRAWWSGWRPWCCRSCRGIGAEVNDARAWVAFGEFSFQPSEFLKLAVVIATTSLLVRRPEQLSDVRRSLPPIAFLAMITAGACLAQQRPRVGDRDVHDRAVGGVHRRRPVVADADDGGHGHRGGGRLRAVERLPVPALHGVPRHHRPPRRAVVPDLPGVPGHRRRRADRLRRRRRQRQARLPAAGPQRLHLRRHRRRARVRSARWPWSAGSCC